MPLYLNQINEQNQSNKKRRDDHSKNINTELEKKRQKNREAARRYREKQNERIKSLEIEKDRYENANKQLEQEISDLQRAQAKLEKFLQFYLDNEFCSFPALNY